MRFIKRKPDDTKADMTPMIDMTFQLIAFFMVLVNFSEAEQDQRIKLPLSMLAQEINAPPENQLTIQVTKTGDCLLDGSLYKINALQAKLTVIHNSFEDKSEAEIIIRAHKEAKTDDIQAIMEECQKTGFKKFKLRAKIPERKSSGSD